MDQPNPSWAAAILVDYMFEVTQEVFIFDVFYLSFAL